MAADLSESGGGLISTTGTLQTTSFGGTKLNGGNTVGTFNATDTGGGDIQLNNTSATPLTIAGVDEWERHARWAQRIGYEIEELIGNLKFGASSQQKQVSHSLGDSK